MQKPNSGAMHAVVAKATSGESTYIPMKCSSVHTKSSTVVQYVQSDRIKHFAKLNRVSSRIALLLRVADNRHQAIVCWAYRLGGMGPGACMCKPIGGWAIM